MFLFFEWVGLLFVIILIRWSLTLNLMLFDKYLGSIVILLADYIVMVIVVSNKDRTKKVIPMLILYPLIIITVIANYAVWISHMPVNQGPLIANFLGIVSLQKVGNTTNLFTFSIFYFRIASIYSCFHCAVWLTLWFYEYLHIFPYSEIWFILLLEIPLGLIHLVITCFICYKCKKIGDWLRLRRFKLALHACKHGKFEQIRKLIQYGFYQSREREDDCKTCLLIASENGHVEIVKFLLQNGSSIDEIDKTQNSCLHLAVKRNQIEVVKYLVQTHISLLGNRNNENKSSEFDIACKEGHIDIIKLLLQKKDIAFWRRYSNPLQIALENNRLGVIKILYQNGWDINKLSILVASDSGYLEIVQYLYFEHNFPLRINNLTCLALAINKGHIDCIVWLLRNGASLDETYNGVTCLSILKSKPLMYEKILKLMKTKSSKK